MCVYIFYNWCCQKLVGVWAKSESHGAAEYRKVKYKKKGADSSTSDEERCNNESFCYPALLSLSAAMCSTLYKRPRALIYPVLFVSAYSPKWFTAPGVICICALMHVGDPLSTRREREREVKHTHPQYSRYIRISLSDDSIWWCAEARGHARA